MGSPVGPGANLSVQAVDRLGAHQVIVPLRLRKGDAHVLAGNDTEWCYILVRRFLNMVEESVKKSTEFAIFEPNDASLWTKAEAKIDNFVIQQWRDGAFAGVGARRRILRQRRLR